MTPLFPILIVVQVVLIAAALLVGVIGYATAGSTAVLIGGIVCAVLVFCGVQMGAVAYHQKLINRLFRNLDPDDFIRHYEYLLERTKNKPTHNCTVRNYLSTGYLAKGDFAMAAKLLQESPDVPEEQMARRDAIRYSNLCNISITQEDLNAADGYLREVQRLLDTEGTQGAGSQAANDITVLKNSIMVLRGWDADESLIKALAYSGTPYHQAVNRYRLGRCLENKHKYEAAAKCYREVTAMAPKLQVAQAAAAQLKKLEERTGEVFA